LGALARRLGHTRVEVAKDPHVALAWARRQVAGGAGLAVATGSIFLVGDLRGALRAEAADPIGSGDPAGAATR
jgi:hypothetical protein